MEGRQKPNEPGRGCLIQNASMESPKLYAERLPSAPFLFSTGQVRQAIANGTRHAWAGALRQVRNAFGFTRTVKSERECTLQ